MCAGKHPFRSSLAAGVVPCRLQPAGALGRPRFSRLEKLPRSGKKDGVHGIALQGDQTWDSVDLHRAKSRFGLANVCRRSPRSDPHQTRHNKSLASPLRVCQVWSRYLENCRRWTPHYRSPRRKAADFSHSIARISATVGATATELAGNVHRRVPRASTEFRSDSSSARGSKAAWKNRGDGAFCAIFAI